MIRYAVDVAAVVLVALAGVLDAWFLAAVGLTLLLLAIRRDTRETSTTIETVVVNGAVLAGTSEAAQHRLEDAVEVVRRRADRESSSWPFR